MVLLNLDSVHGDLRAKVVLSKGYFSDIVTVQYNSK